jgi:hypothetical protein
MWLSVNLLVSARRRRRRVAKFHALQVGQSPVGNYSAIAPLQARRDHGRAEGGHVQKTPIAPVLIGVG